jgi:hypothetical protein
MNLHEVIACVYFQGFSWFKDRFHLDKIGQPTFAAFELDSLIEFASVFVVI